MFLFWIIDSIGIRRRNPPSERVESAKPAFVQSLEDPRFSVILVICHRNHGQFVSGVAHLKNEFRRSGMLTAEQSEAILRCAAESSLR